MEVSRYFFVLGTTSYKLDQKIILLRANFSDFPFQARIRSYGDVNQKDCE